MCQGIPTSGFYFRMYVQGAGRQASSYPQGQNQQGFTLWRQHHTPTTGYLQADHVISLKKRFQTSVWAQILTSASLSMCGGTGDTSRCPIHPPLFILITGWTLRGVASEIAPESLCVCFIFLCVLPVASCSLSTSSSPLLACRNSSKCLGQLMGSNFFPFFFFNQRGNRFIPFCTFLPISVVFGNGGRETLMLCFLSKTQTCISILEQTWQEFFKEKGPLNKCVFLRKQF